MALGGRAADGTSESAGDKGVQEPAHSSSQHQLSKKPEHHPAASLMSVPGFQHNWAAVACIGPIAVQVRRHMGFPVGGALRAGLLA